MRYLSVCSGIEAATVAWESIGWEAAAFSEIEKFPRDLLKHHYPDVPLHGDFTTIKENEYGSVELLVGGTPCQDFSVAGLRKGLSGDRGNLTLEFIRLAQRIRPKWLVWENVPGVLSIDEGRAFGAFLGGLGECGYGFAYRILDAQYFGVPQRRRRVFVVGCLGDWRSSAQVLFERESLCGDITPSRSEREEVAGTFKSRARSGGWGQDIDLAASGYMRVVDETAKRLTSRGAGCGNLDLETANVIAIAGNTIDRLPENGGNGLGFDESGAAYTLTKVDRHAVAFAQNQLGEVRTGDIAGTINQNSNASGRNTPMVAIGFNSDQSEKARSMGERMEEAPTLRAGGEISVATAYRTSPNCGAWETGEKTDALTTGTDPTSHIIKTNMQVRRLTPIECERLQGFPDDYTKINSKTADGPRYKALGNSMAVPVMRWIGEQIERVSA